MDVGVGSAGTADKPIPSAIFVVNFDKVWLAALFVLLESCIWYADCLNDLPVLVFFLFFFFLSSWVYNEYAFFLVMFAFIQ